MGMMDKMMDSMMGKMSDEDKKNMMDSMMGKLFGEMSVDDKKRMMAEMMPKMMGGIDMKAMMPQMMMSMMGGDKGEGGMRGMMSEMMGQADGEGETTMPKMMMKMMPQCIEMMFPKMAKEERTEFVMNLLVKTVEQGLAGLSGQEKEDFLIQVVETVKA